MSFTLDVTDLFSIHARRYGRMSLTHTDGKNGQNLTYHILYLERV